MNTISDLSRSPNRERTPTATAALLQGDEQRTLPNSYQNDTSCDHSLLGCRRKSVRTVGTLCPPLTNTTFSTLSAAHLRWKRERVYLSIPVGQFCGRRHLSSACMLGPFFVARHATVEGHPVFSWAPNLRS